MCKIWKNKKSHLPIWFACSLCVRQLLAVFMHTSWMPASCPAWHNGEPELLSGWWIQSDIWEAREPDVSEQEDVAVNIGLCYIVDSCGHVSVMAPYVYCLFYWTKWLCGKMITHSLHSIHLNLMFTTNYQGFLILLFIHLHLYEKHLYRNLSTGYFFWCLTSHSSVSH